VNREIKFRIWDRQANRWAENDCSLHCCSNWQIDPFTGQLTDFVSALDSDEVTRYNADPAPDYYWKDGKIVNEPRYVLVQYTGLKDKNGVEIYEGDIVRGICLTHGDSIAVVGLDTAFGIFYTDINYYPAAAFLHCFTMIQEHNEVIGNIFENPELLKQ